MPTMSQPAPEFPPLPPSFSTMWSATPETPASSLPWLGPMCAYSAKPEVRALYMAEVGGSLLFIGSGVFVNVAILRLANEAAGCLEDADGSFQVQKTARIPSGSRARPPTNPFLTLATPPAPLPGQDCDLRLLGSRPSSIVAIIAAVVGLASAALAPYAGAVVDHTRHRRAFGAAMAALSLAAALSLIGIGPSSWFALTVCAISVGALAYNGHTLARWAYVRETVESEAELSTVVAAMRAWQICAQFAFLAAVVALSTALGLSDVQTARVAQAVSSAVALPLLAAAWWAFGERPAKHAVAPGQSLWAASVRELRRTLRELGRESPGLRKLLAVTALLSAPLLSFTGLSVSFLTQQVRPGALQRLPKSDRRRALRSPPHVQPPGRPLPGGAQLAVRDDQVALFAGLALISGLPGVLIYRLLSRRVGRRGCLLAATGWWCALIAAYAALLRSPSDQGLAIALALPTGESRVLVARRAIIYPACALALTLLAPSSPLTARCRHGAGLDRAGADVLADRPDAHRARGGAVGAGHFRPDLFFVGAAAPVCRDQPAARRHAPGDRLAAGLLCRRGRHRRDGYRSVDAVRPFGRAPRADLARRPARAVPCQSSGRCGGGRNRESEQARWRRLRMMRLQRTIGRSRHEQLTSAEL